MGGVNGCQNYRSTRNAIKLWSMMKKQRLKCKVSMKRIWRWMLDHMVAFNVLVNQIEIKLMNALKEYKQAKKKAENCRSEFLDSLVKAQANQKKNISSKLKDSIKQAHTVK
jgi:hypothetical protein